MKAVVVSDSHGRFGGIQRIIEKEAPFDMFLHAGDIQGEIGCIEEWAGCPVYVVRGNCDWGGEYPQERMVSFGSEQIFLAHGNRHGVRTGIQEFALAAANAGATVGIFGHTHVPLSEERYGVLLFNPGSVTQPRQKDGRPTYLVLEKEPGQNLQWDFKYLE